MLTFLNKKYIQLKINPLRIKKKKRLSISLSFKSEIKEIRKIVV
ncbi:hypothetical protein I597_0850 [Dokdonia donghaensis DSW-1]|nr:hypothetical protein I597_0850 [Dokdonia donghaensis DSW-1]